MDFTEIRQTYASIPNIREVIPGIWTVGVCTQPFFHRGTASAACVILQTLIEVRGDGVAQLAEHRLDIQKPKVRTPFGAQYKIVRFFFRGTAYAACVIMQTTKLLTYYRRRKREPLIALGSHRKGEGGGALISASAVPHCGVGTDLNTLAWLAEVVQNLVS